MNISKISTNVISKPLEALNDISISDGTLSFFDTEFVDTNNANIIDSAEEDVKTEPIINPNGNRESEIFKIMSKYNIGPEKFLEKRANLGFVSLNRNLGCRVAFNLVVRARGFEFGSEEYVNFDDADPNQLATEIFAAANTNSSNPNLPSYLFDIEKYQALGGAEPANFKNPHVILFAFKKAQDDLNAINGNQIKFFECNPQNYIMKSIIDSGTNLGQEIKDFEDYLIQHEQYMVALALGSAVAGGVASTGRAQSAKQFILAGMSNNMIARIMKMIPGINTTQDMLKMIIFFKTLDKAYSYVIENDMCQNFEKYSVVDGIIISNVGNAFYHVQKNIAGNVRNFLRGLGSMAKTIKDSVSLGVKDFSDQIAPSVGHINYHPFEDSDFQDGRDYHSVTISGMTDDTVSYMYLDDTVLDNAQVMKEIAPEGLPKDFRQDSLQFSNLRGSITQPELQALIRKLISDKEEVSYDTDYLFSHPIGRVEGHSLSEVYCAGSQTTIDIRGLISKKNRDLTGATAGGFSHDYAAVSGIGAFENSQAGVSAGDVLVLTQNGSFHSFIYIIDIDGNVAVFKKMESIDEPNGYDDFYSYNMVLDNTEFKSEISVLLEIIEKKGNISATDIPNIVSSAFISNSGRTQAKTCVSGIDLATAYQSLLYYVESNNLIKKRRFRKKVDRKIKKDEKSKRRKDELQGFRDISSSN